MRGSRFELLLATSALALVVIGSALPAHAIANTDDEISAAVPMPAPANLPPPTAADLFPQNGAQPDGSATPPAAATTAPAATPEGGQVPPAAAVAPDAPQDGQAPAATAIAPGAAPAPSHAAAPAAPVAPPPVVLTGVAEKLRDLFAGKVERFIDRRNKASVESYYAAHNYAPLWSDDGAENARTRAARAYLAEVDADGLDPSDYPVPSFASQDLAALAEAELKFTATVLTYARHAQLGRVHFSRVSADIDYDQVAPEPAAVLDQIANAADVGATLDSFNPPQPGYKALKAKLAEMRGHTGQSGPRIASGPALKVGMTDPRVPALRERLGVTGEPDELIYGKPLAEAVKKFQRQHDVSQSGILTNSVVDLINGVTHRERDADVVIANMERWRWMPRDLGKAYVMVNIPDFTLKVVDQGATVWTTRVVTGEPGEHATPLLTETMKYITVNPTWNVPPSIIRNEYLPALEQDPTVLDRMGLKVERSRDGTVTRIYQPPGDHNALGRLRFNFPNKFLVYQHDTPDKQLFALDKRAFSHGCMRVQNPDQYAEVLLKIANPKDGYTAERIRKMYGGGERDIPFQTPIPVHLTYQTAFVDDAGHLAFRGDLYGRDARLLAMLRSEDRRMAEYPVERREASIERKDLPVDRQSASLRRQAMRTQGQPTAAAPQFFLFGLFR
jgi:L,D-transpeptidase YcbB